jgi:hypothetical protein
VSHDVDEFAKAMRILVDDDDQSAQTLLRFAGYREMELRGKQAQDAEAILQLSEALTRQKARCRWLTVALVFTICLLIYAAATGRHA